MGFTLVELLVVIGIIVVLSAMLIPVVKSSLRKSQSAVCAGNLRQVWMACLSYSTDTGYLPFVGDTSTGANRWQPTVLDGGYLTDARVTMCPSLLRPGDKLSVIAIPPNNQGYGMLLTASPVRVALIQTPSSFAYMGDSVNMAGYGPPQQICWLTSNNGGSADNIVDRRHAGYANILFADGHVEAMVDAQLKKLGDPSLRSFRYSTNSQP